MKIKIGKFTFPILNENFCYTKVKKCPFCLLWVMYNMIYILAISGSEAPPYAKEIEQISAQSNNGWDVKNT